MGYYNDQLLPRLCHLAMRDSRLLPYRKRTVALTEGRVIEIKRRIGLEPSLLPSLGARATDARTQLATAPHGFHLDV